MNTLTQRFFFLAFLGCALLLLPACGSKSNVKSQKPPETVLNPEATPAPTEEAVSSGTAEIGLPGETSKGTPVNVYVEKIKRTKGAKGTKITLTPSTEVSTPVPTTAPSTPEKTPVMETAAPAKRGGSHWIWWLLLLLVLGGIGYYFWSKNQSSGGPFQPNPPTGGLSPVSGFTALQGQIEDEAEEKTSFWFKKIF